MNFSPEVCLGPRNKHFFGFWDFLDFGDNPDYDLDPGLRSGSDADRTDLHEIHVCLGRRSIEF